MIGPEAAGLFALPAGAAIGSFAATAALRGSQGLSLIHPRSHCLGCGRMLGFAELVPALGFILCRGRCRGCGVAIPGLYPLAELAGIVIAAAAFLRFDGWEAVLATGFGWALLAIALRDATDLIIPDLLSLPLLVGGLAVAALKGPAFLGDCALAAAVGGGAFAALALIYRAWRGRDGLGWGDVKLIAALGAWLGLAVLPWLVLIAALLALAAVVVQRRPFKADAEVAFGTWLAVAGWLMHLAAA